MNINIKYKDKYCIYEVSIFESFQWDAYVE